MNRSDIINIMSERYPDLKRSQVEQIVKSVFASMSDLIASGERLEFRGFGSFMLKQRTIKAVRNPRSGELVAGLENINAVLFRCGKSLKDMLNVC